jgi:hypothetical protein
MKVPKGGTVIDLTLEGMAGNEGFYSENKAYAGGVTALLPCRRMEESL